MEFNFKHIVDKYDELKEITMEQIIERYYTTLNRDIITGYVDRIINSDDDRFVNAYRIISGVIHNFKVFQVTSFNTAEECYHDVGNLNLIVKNHRMFYNFAETLPKLLNEGDYFYVFRSAIFFGINCFPINDYITSFLKGDDVIIDNIKVLSTSWEPNFAFEWKSSAYTIYYIIKVPTSERYIVPFEQGQNEITLAPGTFKITNIFKFTNIRHKDTFVFEVEYQSHTIRESKKKIEEEYIKYDKYKEINGPIRKYIDGGSLYYSKYLKYKTKYLKLKNK